MFRDFAILCEARISNLMKTEKNREENKPEKVLSSYDEDSSRNENSRKCGFSRKWFLAKKNVSSDLENMVLNHVFDDEVMLVPSLGL